MKEEKPKGTEKNNKEIVIKEKKEMLKTTFKEENLQKKTRKQENIKLPKDNHRLIIDHYFENFNWIRSVKLVHPELNNNAASRTAHVIRTSTKGKAYIKSKYREQSETAIINAAMITEELKTISFNNIVDYIGLNADDLKQLTPTQQRAVKTIKTTTKRYKTSSNQMVEEEETTIQLHDKIKSLELLGKRIGYFIEDNKQKRPALKIDSLNIEQLNVLNQILTAGDQDSTP